MRTKKINQIKNNNFLLNTVDNSIELELKEMKFVDEFWAFIPARSGSKGLKNKNIKKISGIPLIAFSIKASKKIKKIKKIVFSSDSKKYINIAKKYGCDLFHLRPKKISRDNSSELDAFRDFAKKYYKLNKILPKYFIHFRPTTPVRYLKTIKKGIKFFILKQKKYTAMRSVTLMSEPAYRNFRVINNKLCSIKNNDFKVDKYCRSRKLYPPTYKCNCIVDIYKTKNILNGFLFGNKVLPFITNDFVNDIDDINDFNYVKYFIKKKKFKI